MRGLCIGVILVLTLTPLGLGLTAVTDVTHKLGKVAVGIDAEGSVTQSEMASGRSLSKLGNQMWWLDVPCQRYGEPANVKCTAMLKHDLGTHLSTWCSGLVAHLKVSLNFDEGMEQATWEMGKVVLTSARRRYQQQCFEPSFCRTPLDSQNEICTGGEPSEMQASQIPHHVWESQGLGMCRCLHHFLQDCSDRSCLRGKICQCRSLCPHFKHAFGCGTQGTALTSIGEGAALLTRSGEVHEGTRDATVDDLLINASIGDTSTLDDSVADKCTG